MPRLIVQNSRIVLRSPITSRVRSPAYFLSCGIVADRGELEDVIVGADHGRAFDHDVRLDAAAVADLDVVADDRVGADLSAVVRRERCSQRRRERRSRLRSVREQQLRLGDDLAVDLRARLEPP